jgi:hypothetical protein
MAAVQVTFSANQAYRSLASGSVARYVYKPTGGTATAEQTGRGFNFFASLNGATATDLIPLVTKWDDRAPVQGNCNNQWAVTISGPMDYVIKNDQDQYASCWEFL